MEINFLNFQHLAPALFRVQLNPPPPPPPPPQTITLQNFTSEQYLTVGTISDNFGMQMISHISKLSKTLKCMQFS